jgi:hypothetical protein
MMPLVRAFISFDFDHDEDIKNLLVGQARHPDTPFEITDLSVKDKLPGNWREKVRAKIRGVDQVIVLCGQYTHTAGGVADEVTLAQEERKAYFLLEGRNDRPCTKPTTALASDKMYSWTWDNLKALLGGAR